MTRLFVRTLAVFALVLATAVAASAQNTGTVTGTVAIDGSGQPLAGAQVHIPNTDMGTLSNPEGRFLLLNVPAGEVTVRVQLLGYASQEQTVTLGAGGTATVEFLLKTEAIAVEGLVVTALGIQREQRALAFAVENVSTAQLEQAAQVNVTSALQGKSAGVVVMPTSSQPGSSARIVIRGETSFTGGGEPLWVVDGVPISLDTDQPSGFALNDGMAMSRAMDIDPNNIEDISILRGAAATALYGSRAANGAVIVTTKRGQPGQATRFSLSSRTSFENPILEGRNTEYTAGRWGAFCNGREDNAVDGGWCEDPDIYGDTDTSYQWGPHKDSLNAAILAHEGTVRMVDPRSDYYGTGRLTETSLSASGGIAGGGSFNLGGSYTDQVGMVETSQVERMNLNANITMKLTPRLESNTTVLYSRTDNGFQIEGWNGREQDMWYVPPNLDIRRAWNEDGTPRMFSSNGPHFEWLAENEYYNDLTDRWTAGQQFRLEVIPGLSLENRVGLDTYLSKRTQVQNERPWRTENGQTSGATRQERFSRTQINNDLILNLSGQNLAEGVTASGLVGFNINMRESDNVRGRGRDIVIPDLYNVYNFERQNVYADLPTKQRLMGLFGQATLDYDTWAFLTVTGRNDWSSTLPQDNNSYFYPSAALAIVFTDALGWQNEWLDYGKLRLSYAKVGSDAPPYRLSTTYYGAGGGVDWPFRGQLGYVQGNSLGNPDIKPESTTEYEVGMEMRMLRGRVRLDWSYYDKKSYDQIFSVPSSPATGYSSITRNAGDLRNKGLEVSLQVVPVETEKFSWQSRVNWAKNDSKVQDLAPGVESLQIAGYSWPGLRLMEGAPYGVIWGYGYQRENSEKFNSDGSLNSDYEPFAWNQGKVLIGDDGFPLWDDEQKVLANIQPEWTGNLYNTMRYGPFTLSTLFNMRKGGDILKFDLNYTITRGTAGITANRGDKFTYKGLNATTREPNTVELVRDYDFWQDYGAYNHHENQIEDGSFLKLQELTMQYLLPQSLTQRAGVNSLSVYFTGYNLWISTDYSSGDVQGSNYGATNAGGAAYHFFLQPSVRRYSFGVRTSF